MTTPTQGRLKDAIREALDSGAWERVPEATGYVVRYTERDILTPDWAKHPPCGWNSPTYDRLVFLTIIPGRKWTILLRVSRAPWVGASDTTITFKRAFDVLANPGAALQS